MNRRLMLERSLALGLLAISGRQRGVLFANDAPQAKFTSDLCPGRIGVEADQRQAIQYARQFGFQSVEPYPNYLVELNESQLTMLRATLADNGLVWGAAGLPVQFRADEQTFEADLIKLPQIAAALRHAGVSRVGTWLRPSHNELTYLANFRQHVRRLRAVARILVGSNLRLGLEYVGPKTSWTSRRYAFIHTMAETKELLAEIGADNVGLVLDSWHWYTAGETVEDITSLANKDVVAVDLNDAPAGIARDDQIDSRRELPMASRVIDLEAFLNALVKIGYDGPIRAEPFNQKLNAMDNTAALEATAAAMTKAFALVQS
jgi:sugar phosphate isomerase/epimerase